MPHALAVMRMGKAKHYFGVICDGRVSLCWHLPPFALICDFTNQNTRITVSKISVGLLCYWQIGSKSTNHSHTCDLLTLFTSCLRAVVGGFRSDLAIACMTDGFLGNVSACVLISEVAYQCRGWLSFFFFSEKVIKKRETWPLHMQEKV